MTFDLSLTRTLLGGTGGPLENKREQTGWLIHFDPNPASTTLADEFGKAAEVYMQISQQMSSTSKTGSREIKNTSDSIALMLSW